MTKAPPCTDLESLGDVEGDARVYGGDQFLVEAHDDAADWRPTTTSSRRSVYLGCRGSSSTP